MNLGHVISIISAAAVLIFFILMYAAPGFPAWIVFLVAALAMAIARAVMSNNGKNGGE